MSSWSKLGEFGIKDIEASLEVEDATLGSLFQTVSKQLHRLQHEEKMLQIMLNKLQQEADQPQPIDNDQEDRDGGVELTAEPVIKNTGKQTAAINGDNDDDNNINDNNKTPTNRPKAKTRKQAASSSKQNTKTNTVDKRRKR